MKKPLNAMLALMLFLTFNHLSSTAFGQGTAFTYQGQLQNNGSPASGTYNLIFSLYTNSAGSTAVAGPVTNSAVAVSNGLFTVTIDFGANAWNGQTNWLQIGVESNGIASFTLLTPRQQLTPTPYAIFAEGGNAAGLTGTIPASSLSGNYGSAISLTNAGNSFSGNGSGLTGVNATALGGLTSSNFWQLSGNAGTRAGTNFVGTTDNQPLELHVNGFRALRMEPTANSVNISNAVNFIGGSSVNSASGVMGATIGGGGASYYFGLFAANRVGDNFCTIGGGVNNNISSNSSESTISGGNANSIQPYSIRSVIGGGWENTIGTNANYGTISGGSLNSIQNGAGYSFIGSGNGNFLGPNGVGGGATYSVICGGYFNTNLEFYSFIGGGQQNIIQAAADHSVIVGGANNVIDGATGPSSGFIGGGNLNTIQTNASFAAIGGGYFNTIRTNASYSTIGGGNGNTASSPNGGQAQTVGGGIGNLAGGNAAVVGGGYVNTAIGSSATVGGGSYNYATGNGAFIGGGGWDGSTTVGNTNQGSAATISGGMGNLILGGASYAFIGGGATNTASGGLATIGGGYANTAGGYGATVGGGTFNINNGQGSFIGGGGYDGTFTAGNFVNANAAAICGGMSNSIPAGSRYSFIGGGVSNIASAFYAVVPGGAFNSASGTASFAAGMNAVAGHDGSFIWSDDTGTGAVDTGANQFVARASGGFFFYTGTGNIGARLTSGSTAWTAICDRNAKKNFQPVDTAAVLDKLAAVPIEQWNYKWERDSDVPNIGPMAQDFKHAFYPGRDDTGITTLEFDGVELAAIQGLNNKLESDNAELKRENNLLAKRLDELEAEVKTLAQNSH
jgi:hypothetical protein